jgi:hypothetical protein
MRTQYKQLRTIVIPGPSGAVIRIPVALVVAPRMPSEWADKRDPYSPGILSGQDLESLHRTEMACTNTATHSKLFEITYLHNFNITQQLETQ